MLAHTKADVYAHAHAYGVPYFKDSTPEWSTRGKLRGRVQPLLEEVYGEGYANNPNPNPSLALTLTLSLTLALIRRGLRQAPQRARA